MSRGSLWTVNGEMKYISSVTGRAHYKFKGSLDWGLLSCSHLWVYGMVWDLPNIQQRLVTASSFFSPRDGSHSLRIKCLSAVLLVLLPQGRCSNIFLEVLVCHGTVAKESFAWHLPWEHPEKRHRNSSKQLVVCADMGQS